MFGMFYWFVVMLLGDQVLVKLIIFTMTCVPRGRFILQKEDMNLSSFLRKHVACAEFNCAELHLREKGCYV